MRTRHLRFDIELLAERLVGTTCRLAHKANETSGSATSSNRALGKSQPLH
jgi:hypothetical protein